MKFEELTPEAKETALQDERDFILEQELWKEEIVAKYAGKPFGVFDCIDVDDVLFDGSEENEVKTSSTLSKTYEKKLQEKPMSFFEIKAFEKGANVMMGEVILSEIRAKYKELSSEETITKEFEEQNIQFNADGEE